MAVQIVCDEKKSQDPAQGELGRGTDSLSRSINQWATWNPPRKKARGLHFALADGSVYGDLVHLLVPVSYTHLDVYKRQRRNSPGVYR